MCGIVGRINVDTAVDPHALKAATRLLEHRGPDGEGFYFWENVGFGHRRLSIVDVAQGHQPLSNEEGSIWVTYNGEIYNHAELRAQLEAKGHRFATRSDTEVLVHGYEEWGEALPTHLRGMFAFGIWDQRTRVFFAARDRLGVKPLYWTRAGKDFLFASEIKAFLPFSDVQREADETRVPEYLALRYVPGPQTMFKGIERLSPGHALRFSQGEVTTWPFWDVPVRGPSSQQAPNEHQEEAEFRARFQDAVQVRLMGEVPVGLFLSGGIDSTAVAWAMRQAPGSALKSFSVGFDGDSEGELLYARLAAAALGTQHREVRVSSESFLESLRALVWHLDEPLSDGACIPLMLLSKEARKEVVVVLSGEGADEILGGYGIYPKMLAIEKARALTGSWGQRMVEAALPFIAKPKLRKYVSQLQRPLESRYWGVGRAFGDELMSECFGPQALEKVGSRFEPHWRKSSAADDLHRMLYADTKVWLPDDLLLKADKMTMANSIELRVPFLDPPLLEHVWGLPTRSKLRGREGKLLLKRALHGRIPEQILRRPKKGFPLPLSKWLRSSLHGACREQLLSTNSAARAFVAPKVMERLLTEHRSGQVDRTEELFALWVYDEWHRTFFANRWAQVRNEVRPAYEVTNAISPGLETPPSSPINSLVSTLSGTAKL